MLQNSLGFLTCRANTATLEWNVELGPQSSVLGCSMKSCREQLRNKTEGGGGTSRRVWITKNAGGVGAGEGRASLWIVSWFFCLCSWTNRGSRRGAAVPAVFVPRKDSHEETGEAPQFGYPKSQWVLPCWNKFQSLLPWNKFMIGATLAHVADHCHPTYLFFSKGNLILCFWLGLETSTFSGFGLRFVCMHIPYIWARSSPAVLFRNQCLE